MRNSRRGECLRNGMFRLRFHVAYLAEKLLLGPLGHRRFDSALHGLLLGPLGKALIVSALHGWLLLLRWNVEALPLLTAPEMQPTRAFVLICT